MTAATTTDTATTTDAAAGATLTRTGPPPSPHPCHQNARDHPPASRAKVTGAGRAGHAHATAAARHAGSRATLDEGVPMPAGVPGGHPDLVLVTAVTRGILTAAQAQLIGASRLEHIPMAAIAAHRGISHSALCNQRKRAEQKLLRAITGGLLEDPLRPGT